MAIKTANVLARDEPDIKEKEESIMAKLGIPASVVRNMLYKQIIMTKSIPFSLSLPAAPTALDEMDADVVVIATGADFTPLPLNSPLPVLTPEEILIQGKKPPRRAVIVGGSGTGLSLAVFLGRQGTYDLTILEKSQKAGRDVSPFYLWRYLGLLRKNGARLLTGTVLAGVNETGVLLSSGGEEKWLAVEGIIVAEATAGSFSGRIGSEKKRSIHVIGDARKPRRLHNAIHEGYRLGMEIGNDTRN